MNIAHQHALAPHGIAAGPDDPVDIVTPANENDESETSPAQPRSNGFFRFFSELRRRRVCRAATVYSVAMWLMCQVVELVAPELGLPGWTLKLVIVLGLLGFPIALILSWLIQITPQGFVLERGDETSRSAATRTIYSRPIDRVIDCSLVAAALVIGMQLATGALSTATAASDPFAEKVIVVPFRVASGNDAAAFAEGLLIELHHELANQTNLTVIAPRDPKQVEDSVTITGAVAVGTNIVRVTAMLIDSDTGEVTWSKVFEGPRADSIAAPVEFAQAIVTDLPLPYGIANLAEGDYETR